jgi:hypothetical protein
MNHYMKERISGFLIIMFVPLIPAFVIYYFFGLEQNKAEGIILGLKFGGPIAAYIVLLIQGVRIYESIRVQSENQILENERKKVEYFKSIVGEWSYEEKLFVGGKNFIKKGNLLVKLIGNDNHLFARGQEEKNEYFWETNDVFISRNNDNITADYTLNLGTNHSTMIQGFMELQVSKSPKGKIESMRGEFTALGQERRGEVEFKRK